MQNPKNRKLIACLCCQCGAKFDTFASRVNKSAKIGAPMYCNKDCAGMARRKPDKLTGEAYKKYKSEYDAKRRIEKGEIIKAHKRAFYAANHDRIEAKNKIYRAKHMARHVAYCQRPEYKEWKSEYDRRLRATKQFGEFAESFLMLQDIEKEIDTRATRYEIYSSNGTLNKSLQRKRAL